jgi:hypothetical protein
MNDWSWAYVEMHIQRVDNEPEIRVSLGWSETGVLVYRNLGYKNCQELYEYKFDRREGFTSRDEKEWQKRTKEIDEMEKQVRQMKKEFKKLERDIWTKEAILKKKLEIDYYGFIERSKKQDTGRCIDERLL